MHLFVRAVALAAALGGTAPTARIVTAEQALTKLPLAGRWEANLEKSKRHANHQFKSATLEITVAGDTVTITHGGVNAGGQRESGTVALRADGTPQSLPGQPADIVSVTRWTGSRRLETVVTRDGATIGEQVYEVSADGSTLTATVSGTDASGRTFEQIIVFDRQ